MRTNKRSDFLILLSAEPYAAENKPGNDHGFNLACSEARRTAGKTSLLAINDLFPVQQFASCSFMSPM